MQPVLPLNFIPVLQGTITIGHRPKLKTLPELQQRGITHVVTLLSEKEGAVDIKKAVLANDLQWLWLPLDNAEPPTPDRQDEIKAAFSEWQTLLNTGASLYIHCSAGIHRTGMITYALLRHLDINVVEAMHLLKQMRSITAQDVGSHRLQWGDSFSASYQNMKTYGYLTLDEFLQQNHIGKLFYSHSVGGGYQYRGMVEQVDLDGSLSLNHVETVSNDDYDDNFTNPLTISGNWQPYEDFGYRSTDMDIEISPAGIRISYYYAGTVYIHRQDYKALKSSK